MFQFVSHAERSHRGFLLQNITTTNTSSLVSLGLSPNSLHVATQLPFLVFGLAQILVRSGQILSSDQSKLIVWPVAHQAPNAPFVPLKFSRQWELLAGEKARAGPIVFLFSAPRHVTAVCFCHLATNLEDKTMLFCEQRTDPCSSKRSGILNFGWGMADETKMEHIVKDYVEEVILNTKVIKSDVSRFLIDIRDPLLTTFSKNGLLPPTITSLSLSSEKKTTLGRTAYIVLFLVLLQTCMFIARSKFSTQRSFKETWERWHPQIYPRKKSKKKSPPYLNLPPPLDFVFVNNRPDFNGRRILMKIGKFETVYWDLMRCILPNPLVIVAKNGGQGDPDQKILPKSCDVELGTHNNLSLSSFSWRGWRKAFRRPKQTHCFNKKYVGSRVWWGRKSVVFVEGTSY